ncbi:MAG: ABC transporter substrate-binding protein [Acidimicrobiia bacterium]|nr:ABC transporter substrate-binding protein [Acidimicrobiia bacterium]
MVLAACGDDGGATDTTAGTEATSAETSAGTEESDGAVATTTGGGDTSAGGDEAASGGSFSVYICEPEFLTPTNSNESCGSEVLGALFSPLVTFDPETVAPMWGDEAPDTVAADITSEDNQTWTITLKDGWTFHDGTPLTAQHYVDAWNFGAVSTNAQNNSYFFERIVGYAETQGEVDDEGNELSPPAATELAGLTVVDDLTIEVELGAPFSQFPLMLGYTAFLPAHPSLIEDPDSFNEAPIGNGPYMMDGSWEHDRGINVVRYEDYSGDAGNADAIEFQIFSELATAYNEVLAGNLDIMDTLPPEQLAAAEDQFGDRYITAPSSSFTYLGFPLYEEAFQNPDIRKALSMAIDRQPIVDAIYNGTRTPADSFVAPVVDGYREGACGEACTFDPEAAKVLFDEAGGIDGPVTMWFNSGAGHEEWIEAIANQWRQNLGIEEIVFESLEFADYLGRLDQNSLTGPFRLGWLMDYPSAESYLTAIYTGGASSNYSGYDNPDFDALIDEGDQAATQEEAIAAYNAAEDLLIEDLPSIPLWFREEQGIHSERVSNVTIDVFAHVNLPKVVVND